MSLNVNRFMVCVKLVDPRARLLDRQLAVDGYFVLDLHREFFVEALVHLHPMRVAYQGVSRSESKHEKKRCYLLSKSYNQSTNAGWMG